MGRKTPSGKAAMATTDEKAGEASPRGPAGAEMMPTLPEPWERLIDEFGQAEYVRGLDRLESVSSNHAAFEAERALRVALGDLLRQLNG